MKTVYKYPVPGSSAKFSLMLPMDFKFLRIHYQRDQLQLWIECDPEKKTVRTEFELFGTGQKIPDHAQWLQTYDNGPFVMHLFKMN